jgi:hypothetical protein
MNLSAKRFLTPQLDLDTLVNKGKKKGRGVFDPAQLSISLRAVGVDTLSASEKSCARCPGHTPSSGWAV